MENINYPEQETEKIIDEEMEQLEELLMVWDDDSHSFQPTGSRKNVSEDYSETEEELQD